MHPHVRVFIIHTKNEYELFTIYHSLGVVAYTYIVIKFILLKSNNVTRTVPFLYTHNHTPGSYLTKQ